MNRLRRADVYSKADYWDQKAAELDGTQVSMWPNGALNRLYHDEQLEIVDRLLPSLEGKRVLDVGCGTGRMSRYAAERGAQVKGIDFSAGAIEIARRAGDGENPEYVVQSIFDLDERDRYDVVLSWGSVAVASRNASELRDAMERLYRALRPGGQILLLEPVHRGFLHRVLDMHVDRFVEVMEEASFEVREVIDMHFWPARLALAYLPVPEGLTRRGYALGQKLMKAAFPRAGDYKAIFGRRRA